LTLAAESSGIGVSAIGGVAVAGNGTRASAQSDDVPTPGAEVLGVRDLNVTFENGGRPVHAVRGVDFTVHTDECLVIVGESGSGKSVTARSILGLLPPRTTISTGSIRFRDTEFIGAADKSIRQFRGTGISMVFQDPMRSLNPTMKVGRQISEGMRKHLGVSRKEGAQHAIDLLERVGIAGPARVAGEYPYQLSGGMRQRAMIALAISCHPALLVADEPTTALDATTSAQIMELLSELQREFHMGLLLITHDLALALEYGDSVAVMYAGKIVEVSPAARLAENIRMPYTKGLFDSVPKIEDAPHAPFMTLPGRPPDSSDDWTGCSFAPRCSFVEDRCRDESPSLEGDETHRWACWYPL
jgi:oligopeptide/dipeptide ABC transporter ATP-binding protein